MITAVATGRLTEAPQLRQAGEAQVARFRIASDNPGGRGTTFIDVDAWRKLGETCAAHLAKGQMVTVDGQLRSREFEGSDGVRRTVYEIVADHVEFGPKARGAQGDNAPEQGEQGGSATHYEPGEEPF